METVNILFRDLRP